MRSPRVQGVPPKAPCGPQGQTQLGEKKAPRGCCRTRTSFSAALEKDSPLCNAPGPQLNPNVVFSSLHRPRAGTPWVKLKENQAGMQGKGALGGKPGGGKKSPRP